MTTYVRTTPDIRTTPPPVVAAVPVSAAAQTAPGDPAIQSFGMMGDMAESISATPQRMLASVGASVQKMGEGLAHLDVATYTSSKLSDVKYQDGAVMGAQLRALTRVSIGGNTQVVLPETADGKLDEVVWKIHSEALERALANRNELVKLTMSALTGLIGSTGK